MKELGLTPKVKRSSGQGEATHETRRTGTNTTPIASSHSFPTGSEGRQRRWQPDEGETCAAREETPTATSGTCDDRSNDKLLDEALASTRVLSSDAKSVLNDVQQGKSQCAVGVLLLVCHVADLTVFFSYVVACLSCS